MLFKDKYAIIIESELNNLSENYISTYVRFILHEMNKTHFEFNEFKIDHSNQPGLQG